MNPKWKTMSKEIGMKILEETKGMDDGERFDLIVSTCLRLSALPMVMLTPEGYPLYVKEYVKNVEEILNEYQSWDKKSNHH